MRRTAIVLIPVALLLWLAGSLLLDQRHARLNASLIHAVNNRDALGVDRLLAQGADPNTRDWKTYYPGGEMPLRLPWYEKYLAKIMHRQPRETYPYSYVGPTVLMIAAHHGDTTIVRSLLNDGADMTKLGGEIHSDYANRLLSFPLKEAIGCKDHFTALLLIDRGSSKTNNLRDEFGWTPLMLTSNLELVNALIDHGADVNAADSEGSTALCHAALLGDSALACLLLNRGATINGHKGVQTALKYGRPLTYAVVGSNSNLVHLFLARGADVNGHGTDVTGHGADGQTALIAACIYRKMNNAKLLLARGEDVNSHDLNGDTALLATSNMTYDNSLQSIMNDIWFLNLLLSHGAEVNTQNNAGQTALMRVSYDRPWMRDLNFKGEMTRTQWKAERRAMQKLLIQHGANTLLKDKRGKTAADYENEVQPD
jgi:ankyrin repeat protein